MDASQFLLQDTANLFDGSFGWIVFGWLQGKLQISCTGRFYHWYPPKKLKYGKPRFGESTLTEIVLDTPNIA